MVGLIGSCIEIRGQFSYSWYTGGNQFQNTLKLDYHHFMAVTNSRFAKEQIPATGTYKSYSLYRHFIPSMGRSVEQEGRWTEQQKKKAYK